MVRNVARSVVALLAFTGVLGSIACNYTDGPCYRREDIEGGGPNGAGGGPIIPGAGGFGDTPPPRPQSTTDPQPVACEPDQPDQKQPGQGSTGGSCGDIPDGTVTAGATYASCSGPCAAKCLSIAAGSFSPSAFSFTTTVNDNGEGKAGGWQVATATLKFVRLNFLIPESWTCTISVGMPLRTEAKGTIPANTAATITAAVATQASSTVMGNNPDLPQGIFCSKFKAEMGSVFASEVYKGYGARMMDP